MNWYKKAKIINKSKSTEDTINLSCMYCNRFATHPTNEKAKEDEHEWKTLEEMNTEENTNSRDNYKKMKVSHGICPICTKIINSLWDKGINPFRLKPKEITEMSLRKRID